VRRRRLVKALYVGILTTVLAVSLTAQDRKTVYVDRMEGLEPFVEKALQDAELPFDFVEEEKQPEMKAGLRRMQSAYGEILYKHKLGRNETHRLEFRDVKSNKVLASHVFQLKGDDESRRVAASEFASKVRKALDRRGGR
jgi:hypothetical protein